MSTNDHGGLLDADANYHFTRIEIADAGNTKNVPELCLAEFAEEALSVCLRRRGVTVDFFGPGFAFGLHIARVLLDDPYGCEETLRALLDRKAAEILADASEVRAK